MIGETFPLKIHSLSEVGQHVELGNGVGGSANNGPFSASKVT